MLRRLTVLTVFFGALTFSASAFAQDQPSLGDVARQARKDKENSTVKSKTVVTEDTMPARASGSSALSGLDVATAGSPSASGASDDPLAQATAKFNEAEADYNRLDSLDQANLAKVALAEDCEVQFPSRASWEVKLWAAKGAYVTHMRSIIADLKQLTTEAQGWKGPNGKLDPNDPRVQAMRRKMQSALQDASQSDARFEEVVSEGVALARAAKQR